MFKHLSEIVYCTVYLLVCETRERMEAMEKQIASLTGLLQRVLSRAPEAESP